MTCGHLPWEDHIGRAAREMNSLKAYWSVTWGGGGGGESRFYATKHFSDNAIWQARPLKPHLCLTGRVERGLN